MEYTYLNTLMNNSDMDVLSFAVAPFTGVIGDYFYLIFGLIPVFMLYLKAQDIVLPLIGGFIFTAGFGYIFPENLAIAIIMLLGTALGAVIFQVFKGSGD